MNPSDYWLFIEYFNRHFNAAFYFVESIAIKEIDNNTTENR